MIKTKVYNLEEHQVTPNYEKQSITQNGSSQFCVKIHKMDHKYMEIDMIGMHTSLVNAYRRIITAEVATLAIEKVFMYLNSSVVQDEVLSHRIGLVPLNAPPHLFNFRLPNTPVDEFTEETCVKFRLRVKCRSPKDSQRNATDKQDPDDVGTTLVDKLVTSEHLEWVPIGNQMSTFSSNPLRPLRETITLPSNVKVTNTDLVLAKLNPGQRLLLEAVAYKGIGSDHSKFQPGHCWYRFLPQVTFLRPVVGNDASLLQSLFSEGTIELFRNKKGEQEARVKDARYDTCSRNVFRHDHLKDAVKLSKNSEHIIFCVESYSALKSYEILEAAVDIMIGKCDTLLELLSDVGDD